MTPVELSRTVLHAVRRAVDQGELSVAVPARAVVTPPGPGGSGDYATNIALQLARPAGRPPRQVAEILRPHLSRTEGVAAVEITGPGFLNIHLDRAAVTSLVGEVLDRRDDGLPYGHGDALAGQVVRLRIPYDIRAEVVADAVVRIVASQGGRVEVDHVRPSAGRGRGSRTAGDTDTSQASEASGGSDQPDNSAEAIDLRPVPAPEDPTPLGPDALRWALLHPAAHDRPRVTADLLVQRAGNPLFRVRYAHARARALTRNAATLGFTSTPGRLDATAVAAEPQSGHPDVASAPRTTPGAVGVPGPDRPAPDRAPAGSGHGLTTSAVTTGTVAAETAITRTGTAGAATRRGVIAGGDHGVIAAPFTGPGATTASDPAAPLLAAISEYPHVVLRAATLRTPDRLARHLVVTADALLAFQHMVLPRGDEKPSAAHRARLALAEAAGTVLAGGLSLLGIDAPEYL